jgi:hypothetical protein
VVRISFSQIPEAPKSLAVGDIEPEVAERELDVATEKQDNADRHKKPRDADLVRRGGQQRKLKQEQRQHDIAKIDRCCNGVLTEADEEIDPHHAKRKHAPGYQSVDLG